MCSVGVHQKCYGGKLKDNVPDGEWYCERCENLRSNPEKKCFEIKCMFCPKIDGIIKPVSFLNPTKQ